MTIIGAKGNKRTLSQIKRGYKNKPKITDYERRERQESLTKLGFLSYNGYTRSKLWKGIRERVLERDGGKCIGCGNEASQVHHRSYDFETMAGTNLIHLQSACGSCHIWSHRDGETKTIPRKKRKKGKRKKSQRWMGLYHKAFHRKPRY